MKYVTLFGATTPIELPLHGTPRVIDRVLDFADGDIRINRHFLEATTAANLQRELLAAVEWRQDMITLFGKTHRLPRLHQWYGDTGTEYHWSGITLRPCPWLAVLADLRRSLEAHTGAPFNCVLVNLYRDGNDCMGWHADDEPELGAEPVIASISLGAERDLLLRRRPAGRSTGRRISLTDGSLLIMAGATQAHWQHALPRRKRVTDPRINLTFRYIRADGRGSRTALAPPAR